MKRRGFLHKADTRRLKTLGIHLSAGRHSVAETARFEPPCRIGKPLNHFSGSIGAFSYCESRTEGVQKIGRYCSISHDVHFGGAEHPWWWATTSSFAYDTGWIWKTYLENLGRTYTPRIVQADSDRHRAIEIGNDVWIGVGAFIRAGVHIGDGAVVGAHACVTKNVEPYTIVAGNPARVIRKRFTDDVIEKLQALRWWDYQFPDFDGFPVENPEGFIAAVSEGKARGTLKPYTQALFTGADLAGHFRRWREISLSRLFT